MLKIESKDFYPLEGDKDFKITLKVPSFSEYQDVEIEANKYLPSGGPNPKSDPAYLKSKVEKLFEFAVESVHGFEVKGKPVIDWKGLFEHAPQKIVLAIMEEINRLAHPTEAEIKN